VTQLLLGSAKALLARDTGGTGASPKRRLAASNPLFTLYSHMSPHLVCRLGAKLLTEPKRKGKRKIESNNEAIIFISFVYE
jgi:hypothetical protein